MLYFAYGSNMCTGRLTRRLPSARPLRIARLARYTFHFHKRSDDGSGKGNALHTNREADIVWGVIFALDPKEKEVFDQAEGLNKGYCDTTVTVTDQAGVNYEAHMYVAEPNSIDDTLRPYSWYKRFVVDGARQHQLPADYVAEIERTEATEDPNRVRDARNREIGC
jgi:hypothetical protein